MTMNREIKFMAWDKECGAWVEEDIVIGADDGRIFLCDTDMFCNEILIPYKNPIDLYQFTGLHDKDGKKIYEGHIVIVEDVNRIPRPQYTAVIYWMERGALGLYTHKDQVGLGSLIHYNPLQIIGHIAEEEK